VPVVDDVRGHAVEMYISVKPGVAPTQEVADKVSRMIETEIGKVARPKNVWIVADMPKTRSGKIMRRVIASISNFTDVGDITTLANPDVVEGVLHQVHDQEFWFIRVGSAPRLFGGRRRRVENCRCRQAYRRGAQNGTACLHRHPRRPIRRRWGVEWPFRY
jgi:hypothetical protein